MSDYEKGFIYTNRANEPVLTEDKLVIDPMDELNKHNRIESSTKFLKESFNSSLSNNSSHHGNDNYDKVQSASRRVSTKINESSKWESICHKVEHILEGRVFNIIFTIAIVTNLFLEDIRLLLIPYRYDFYIEIIILILFLFFCTEFVMSIIFIKNFRFSVFFYFDLIAISGLIPEVHLLYESHHGDYVYAEKNNMLMILLKNSHLTKVIRITVSGSKLGRMFSVLNNLSLKKTTHTEKENITEKIKAKYTGLYNKYKMEKYRLLRRKSLGVKRNTVNLIDSDNSFNNHIEKKINFDKKRMSCAHDILSLELCNIYYPRITISNKRNSLIELDRENICDILNLNDNKKIWTDIKVDELKEERYKLDRKSAILDYDLINKFKHEGNVKKSKTYDARHEFNKDLKDFSIKNNNKGLYPDEITVQTYPNIDDFSFKMKIFKDGDIINNKEFNKLSVKSSKQFSSVLIILMLLILFIFPYLDDDMYDDFPNEHEYNIILLQNYLDTNVSMFLKRFYNNINKSDDIIYFGFNNRTKMCQYGLCFMSPNKTLINITNTIRYNMKIQTNTTDLFLVYDISYLSNLETMLAMCKVLFVTFLLWMGAFVFMKDMNKYITIHLESVYHVIKNQDINIEDLYYNYNTYLEDLGIKVKRNIYEEEIQILEMFYLKSSQNLAKILGIRCYNFMKYKILNSIENIEDSHISPFFKLKGVIMMIFIDIDHLSTLFKEDITLFYSKLIEKIDLTCLELLGEILKLDNNSILVFWDTKMNIGSNISLESNDNNEFYKKNFNNPQADTRRIKQLLFSKINNKNQSLYYDFAMMAALKILSRIKHDNYLNNLFFEYTNLDMSTNLDIKLIIDNGNLTNLVTFNENKVDSIYVSKRILNIKSIYKNLKNMKINMPLIYTNGIYKKLNPLFKDIGRNISYMFDNKEKIFCHDIKYTYQNPYQRSNFMFNKDNSIVLRKELIDNINSDKFDIELMIKNDVELLFSRVDNIKNFLKNYNKGIELLKIGNLVEARSMFNSAINIMDDEITHHLINLCNIEH